MVDGALFSGVPSEELLRRMGFEPWVEPAPTPEELLARAKAAKVDAIEAYDVSDAVSGFTYKGVEMWLDKATRTGLLMRFTAEQAMGRTETTLWLGEQSFTLPLADAFALLYVLEVYASGCYDRTAAHKAAVDALETVEAVEAYDHTAGYPEKIELLQVDE